jgi:hypothetical protein
MSKQVKDQKRREKERTGGGAIRFRYRTKNQIDEEMENLEIAGRSMLPRTCTTSRHC